MSREDLPCFTVKQLINKLKQLPQDQLVFVYDEETGNRYAVNFIDDSLDDCIDINIDEIIGSE